jgi:hypothetical protein
MTEFRPNNSKEAPKNSPWPEKFEALKGQNVAKSDRKTGRKIFLQMFRSKTTELFVVFLLQKMKSIS